MTDWLSQISWFRFRAAAVHTARLQDLACVQSLCPCCLNPGLKRGGSYATWTFSTKKFIATRSVKKSPIYKKSLIIDKCKNRQMLIENAKVAQNQKKLFYKKDHEAIDFLGIYCCSTYKYVSKSQHFIRVYCFEFNLESFDLCVSRQWRSKRTKTLSSEKCARCLKRS